MYQGRNMVVKCGEFVVYVREINVWCKDIQDEVL